MVILYSCLMFFVCLPEGISRLIEELAPPLEQSHLMFGYVVFSWPQMSDHCSPAKIGWPTRSWWALSDNHWYVLDGAWPTCPMSSADQSRKNSMILIFHEQISFVELKRGTMKHNSESYVGHFFSRSLYSSNMTGHVFKVAHICDQFHVGQTDAFEVSLAPVERCHVGLQ